MNPPTTLREMPPGTACSCGGRLDDPGAVHTQLTCFRVGHGGDASMIDYPTDAAERARLREQRIREGRRRGEEYAQELMRSLNCRNRFRAHGEDHEPCLNDGTSCLCSCHDRATAKMS